MSWRNLFQPKFLRRPKRKISLRHEPVLIAVPMLPAASTFIQRVLTPVPIDPDTPEPVRANGPPLFREGRTDRIVGKSSTACPYGIGTAGYQDWLRGWMSADEDLSLTR